ncbi:MAG TPA: 2-amino-4-hydroxy-6-hydroxymethyldihydropteridine diphosphokinase [Cyclobacteriaceae bacterium]|nr:2-amino-4-hydroxy-6-hydroxymethyldihydropteridine diphosphokinase [Cyclobacteriaceae bacterium]
MRGGIFLLLGSNLGDRLQHLSTAASHINTFATVLRKSSVYVTGAWGNNNQPDFLNQVIEVDTGLSPEALLQNTLGAEIKMGRNRIEKWGPRTIDIDILFFGESIVTLDNLQIPHPQIQNRKFTLVPLRELAPDLVHPVLKKSIARLDDECTDSLEVTRLPPQHSEQSS